MIFIVCRSQLDLEGIQILAPRGRLAAVGFAVWRRARAARARRGAGRRRAARGRAPAAAAATGVSCAVTRVENPPAHCH